MNSPTRRSGRWRPAVLGVLVLAVGGGLYASRTGTTGPTPSPPTQDFGRLSGLPLPHTVSVPQFEEQLFRFLHERRYARLGWAVDKGVRDTGPYMNGKYYGTHPAVRVFYSPGVMRWLVGGRVGKIPDGEMIIKEQYAAPAARHHGKNDDELWGELESWTVMIKDSSGSHDGWFWSNPVKNQCVVDEHQYPFPHPVSGFGHYCVRCHASTHSPGTEPAADTNEFVFISTRNIAGFPGEPILFRVDDSWREDARKKAGEKPKPPPEKCVRPDPVPLPTRTLSKGFADFFASVKPEPLSGVAHLPPVTHDWATARRDGSREFVTSNQCMSCHSGLVGPFGPSMFVPKGKGADYGDAGWDVSPHGEWRWTPMGLAGRDPVFFAQMETEMRLIRDEFKGDPALADELSKTLTDTCLKCHGVMGHRQFARDHGGREKFTLAHAMSVAGPHEHPGGGDSKYGALARDGVSCAVCHRMQPRPQPADDKRPYLQFFLESSVTGNFRLGPPGEVYGPLKDDQIAPYAMEHATGLKPKHDEFLKSSQMCGTCHTVALPNVDKPRDAADLARAPNEVIRSQPVELFRKFQHHVEQATYLEWLNSEYENEVNPANPKAKSCQDCHMSAGLKDARHGIDVPQLKTRIAAVQDRTYPDAENLAPHDKIDIRFRETGYRRHNFAGLNVFLVEMFNQFDDVLGVRKTDFMTGGKDDAANAVADMARRAREETADVAVDATWDGSNRLTARVVVTNKAGHRFPTGVGFRRAFLEFVILDGTDRVVWASGRTNDLGVLVGADDKPLPTEFFARDPATGKQQFQPHHDIITSPDQVQVYETLLRNAKGEFTTSFVRGCESVKDNRLLPRGWKADGPGPALTGKWLHATHPDGTAAKDPRYADGSGTDEVTYRVELPAAIDRAKVKVRATLHYQAIPPYYLRNLFETAPDGPATRRLHHISSHLNLKGTPIDGWKLPVASATAAVKGRP